MREKPPEAERVYAMRHGAAAYEPDISALKEPNVPMDLDLQKGVDDLTEKGEKEVVEKTGSFLEHFDPKLHVFLIAASPAARAAQTAKIFHDIATKQGFAIAEGGVMTIDALKPLNMEVPSYIADLFSPVASYPKGHIVNEKLDIDAIFEDPNTKWNEKISDEDKVRWVKAKKIISDDDRGSWGLNFETHSSQIAELYPEIEIENYLNQHTLSDRLVEKGKRWISIAEERFAKDENSKDKKLVILAVGHEEAVNPLLHGEHFGNAQIINASPLLGGT